jgi:hypothetical protein
MRPRIHILTRSEHGVSLTGFTLALTAFLLGLMIAAPDVPVTPVGRSPLASAVE